MPAAGPAEFVGSEKCKNCHETAYDKWRGSHHDLAMDEANEQTVLGDFSDAKYIDPYNNVTTRFFRRDGRFLVETEGPDGQPGVFEITHTFGAYPLQQYLVPFPGGRLQCLNIAWDVEKKAWYRLPPYEVDGPDDWLHWTRGGQTWNAMCAECHSTQLDQRVRPGTEAIRPPGSRSMSAAKPATARAQDMLPGLTTAFRPTAAENYALEVRTGRLITGKQI